MLRPPRAFLRPRLRAAPLALAAALSLVVAPRPADAAPPTAPSPAASIEPSPNDASPPEADAAPPHTPAPTVVAADPDLSGGSVAGNLVDPDDPDAKRARSELEGESLRDGGDDLPTHLPPLQRAAWIHTFAAGVLFTAAGVFAGLVERQEDEAARMAGTFDLTTGSQPLYEDQKDEYDALLSRGETYTQVAQGLAIAGGVALVTAGVLFVVHHRRARKERASTRSRLRGGPAGLELRF